MTNPRLRVWCLFLLSSADYAGLAPLSRSRFHRLFFLANTFASYYQTDSFVNLVYKWTHGPFYPDAQWELGRLIGTGLARLESFKLVSKARDKWDLESVSLHTDAIQYLHSFRKFEYWRKVEQLQRETAIALASIEESDLNNALMHDDIYPQTGSTVLRFGTHNSNIERIEDIIERVKPQTDKPTNLDILRIYSKLIDLRASA